MGCVGVWDGEGRQGGGVNGVGVELLCFNRLVQVVAPACIPPGCG